MGALFFFSLLLVVFRCRRRSTVLFRSAVCVLLFKELNANCESRCNGPLLSVYLSRYGVQASASETLSYPFDLCVCIVIRHWDLCVCVGIGKKPVVEQCKGINTINSCVYFTCTRLRKRTKFSVKKTVHLARVWRGTHTVLAHSFDLTHSHSIHYHTQRDSQRSIQTYLCMQLSANSDERATHTLSRHNNMQSDDWNTG